MGAVQGVGPGEVQGIIEVRSVVDEVAVQNLRDISREGVGGNDVHALDARQGIPKLGLEGDEQSVVNGAANGEQHFVLSQVRINSGKGAGWARGSASGIVAGVQTITCVIRDLSSLADGAADARLTSWAAK